MAIWSLAILTSRVGEAKIFSHNLELPKTRSQTNEGKIGNDETNTEFLRGTGKHEINYPLGDHIWVG